MKKIIKRLAKDAKASATLEFYVIPGRPLFVCSQDFRLAGDPHVMRVTNFVVDEKHHGASGAHVVGIRDTHHLGFPREYQRSILRMVRRLVMQALESYQLRKLLRDTRTRLEYEDSVATIRQLQRDLVERKKLRTAILIQMVRERKLKAPAPFKLPVIP